MTPLSNDRAIAIQTFPLIPTPQGQVTLPPEILDRLQPNPDNPLVLLKIDDLILLTSKQTQVTQLSEQFTAQMAKYEISLEELLDGLQEERQILWQESHKRLRFTYEIDDLSPKYARSINDHEI